ncbi:MAG: threonine synthase [Candidatus Marinimicrobia bacterium]|nr:threonine synthase [Candidatus Neomarinimicrobiota bacterium]
MKYYNINNRAEVVDFETAVLNNVAKDGGLYIPCELPQVNIDFLKEIKNLSFKEISFNIGRTIFKDDIPDNILATIIDKAFTFEPTIKELNEDIRVIELFNGPTLSFKDFAARFMANYMSYLAEKYGKKLTVLVATSGDTGSAVANAFYGIDNIKVYVLYPSQRISKIQEMQIATFDENVQPIEIEGTFDDCQGLVKKAFVDEDLNKKLNLTSSNSINVARLVPQSLYYFYSVLKLIDDFNKKIAICVPSGNFGNLTAGILSKKMGLPVYKYVAATNCNDSFIRFLKTGKFEPNPTIKTYANAMDVGNPNNFQRLYALYNNSFEKIKSEIAGYSFDNNDMIDAIKYAYEYHGYVLEPHGACGYKGIISFKNEVNNSHIYAFLETAHPGKFKDIVEMVLQVEIEIPESLKQCLSKKKNSIKLPDDFKVFKNYLIEN